MSTESIFSLYLTTCATHTVINSHSDFSHMSRFLVKQKGPLLKHGIKKKKTLQCPFSQVQTRIWYIISDFLELSVLIKEENKRFHGHHHYHCHCHCRCRCHCHCHCHCLRHCHCQCHCLWNCHGNCSCP